MTGPSREEIRANFQKDLRPPRLEEIEGLGKFYVRTPTLTDVPKTGDEIQKFIRSPVRVAGLVQKCVTDADGRPVFDANEAKEFARSAPVDLLMDIVSKISGRDDEDR